MDGSREYLKMCRGLGFPRALTQSEIQQMLGVVQKGKVDPAAVQSFLHDTLWAGEYKSMERAWLAHLAFTTKRLVWDAKQREWIDDRRKDPDRKRANPRIWG